MGRTVYVEWDYNCAGYAAVFNRKFRSIGNKTHIAESRWYTIIMNERRGAHARGDDGKRISVDIIRGQGEPVKNPIHFMVIFLRDNGSSIGGY